MKSANQKVVEARAALARAIERQRREDTRCKIVCGALALEFIERNRDRLAPAFLNFIDKKAHAERDAALIVQLREGLKAQQPAANDQRTAVAAAGQISSQQNRDAQPIDESRSPGGT